MSNVTEKALSNSLRELLTEKPIDKITVGELTERCGISRMTFYYHFADIYDLADWTCRDITQSILEGKKTYETWQEGYLAVFKELIRERNLAMNVYQHMDHDTLAGYLHTVTYHLVRDVVDEEAAASGLNVSPEDRGAIADFYQYGLVGLVMEWVREGMESDPQAIVDECSTTIEGAILLALQNYAKKNGTGNHEGTK
jgi:probable dihydroxyacetone kinase regulator